MTLHVVNNTSAPMDAGVSVELAGLGVQRTQQLGHVLVPAKGARDVEWVPTTSPIKASGVLIRAMARVSYVQGGTTLSIPSEPLFTSFSADGARVFATVGDGSQVRERAAATHAKGAPATGAVDGKAVAVGDTQSAASPPRPSQNELDLASQSAPAAQAAGTGPRDNCLYLGGTHEAVNMCAYYGGSGFRDVQISSPDVPTESFNPILSPASYANASISIGGTVLQTGVLDASGCMSFSFCRYRNTSEPTPTISVATDSLSVLAGGGEFKTRSHIFQILPATTFTTAALGPVSSDHATAWLFPGSDQDNYVLRTAAIVSHMLTMTPYGGGDEYIPFYPLGNALTSTVDTTNGCPSFMELQYAPGLYGEACTNPGSINGTATVSLGPSLGRASDTDPYQLTGHHTTEDAFSVAHELGHAIQFISNLAYPFGDYNDKGTDYYCSCNNVNDGNRIHCLQSSHGLGTSYSEGFAHHHAVRLMNTRGVTTPRFTYYKDVLAQVDPWPALQTSYAPPVPVNAGQPYQYFAGQNGWVTNWCSAPSRASEYDWMTFLWAVNGATSTGRINYFDLLNVFSSPLTTNTAGLTYQNVEDAANARFGSTSLKAQLVGTQLVNNGLTL